MIRLKKRNWEDGEVGNGGINSLCFLVCPVIQFLSLLSILITDTSASILLRGKVYDDKTNPVKNFSLRLSSFGNVTTTNSGEFMIELPDDVQFVEIDMSDRNFVLIYPIDKKIPIPSDQNYISKIVVSKSSATARTEEDAAKKYSSLESLLKEIGVAQSELKELIESFIKKESEENNLDEKVLREAIFKEKRGESFAEISQVLLNYIMKALNLKDSFRLVSELAFENRNALQELITSIEEYNIVLNQINNNKLAYQSDITLYWNNSDQSDKLIELIDYAIDEIHKPFILKLNELRVQINKILSAEMSKSERESLKEKTKADISGVVNELERRLPVLENKSNTFLARLNPSNLERE